MIMILSGSEQPGHTVTAEGDPGRGAAGSGGKNGVAGGQVGSRERSTEGVSCSGAVDGLERVDRHCHHDVGPSSGDQAAALGPLDHHQPGPVTQEETGGFLQVGAPGEGRRLDLAGQEHVTAGDRTEELLLVAGEVVLLRVEVDGGDGPGPEPAGEGELRAQRHPRQQDPVGLQHLGRDVVGLDRQRLEMFLAVNQGPASVAVDAVLHDVADRGQRPSGHRVRGGADLGQCGLEVNGDVSTDGRQQYRLGTGPLGGQCGVERVTAG